MREWTTLEKALAAVAAVVFVGVAALGVVAWRSGGDSSASVPEGCQGETLDSELTTDASPVDALRSFVQTRPELFPVDDSWTLRSDDDGTYVFGSENGGRFEVEVRRGLVRRYLSCPD